jgi:hypothetical protein
MSMMRPGGEDAASRFARTISRRKFLDRSLRGVTTAAVGLFATGTIFSDAARAGEDCPCSAPHGVTCPNCPPGRKAKKCPDGYQRCRTVDGVQQCPGCIYESGFWVSCTGLGEGFGYKICIDCVIPGDCDSSCGCRSSVICRHCTSAADVKAEMALSMSGTE